MLRASRMTERMVDKNLDEMQWNLGEVIPDANEARLKAIAKKRIRIY